MAVGADKATNIRRACQMVKEAARNGAGMVVLPVRIGWGHWVILVDTVITCSCEFTNKSMVWK